MNNDFILMDRIQKIQQIIKQYGEEQFYISYSGGKDSTVLSALIDMAIPNNTIPRVYVNTGIEYKMIYDFVSKKSKNDNRIIIIQPTTNIKRMLVEDGFPFKSKGHSEFVERYQRRGMTNSVLQYLGERPDKKPWSSFKSCPKILKYQFSCDFTLKISDKCCKRLKVEPLKKWRTANNRPYAIIGLMRDEGGRRTSALCLAFSGNKLKSFQPLVPVTKEWEDWFIDEYKIEICPIYRPPYNFVRTGCKGCPFAIGLQHELDVLEHFFPDERKQCEFIWKPVYDEYRRLNYRLKGDK